MAIGDYEIRDNWGRKIGTISSSSSDGCGFCFLALLVLIVTVLVGVVLIGGYLFLGVKNLVVHHSWDRPRPIIGINRMIGNVVEKDRSIWLGNKGAKVQYEVTVQGADDYNLRISRTDSLCSHPTRPVTVDVSINGGTPITVGVMIDSWDKSTDIIPLRDGKNTVTLSHEVNGGDPQTDSCVFINEALEIW